ncbi:MAG: TonB-dependent receptor, partial [Deltaproteobacteria bacterium]|nr:TonB-dependent receptor [Deltaproteobacteria bacterium]
LRYSPPGKGFYLEFFTRFAAEKTRLHPSDLVDLRICQDPNHLGDSYADAGLSCPGTGAWATINVRGGYRFHRSLRLDLAATNLGDLRYRYHGSGIDAPGIGISMSLLTQY